MEHSYFVVTDGTSIYGQGGKRGHQLRHIQYSEDLQFVGVSHTVHPGFPQEYPALQQVLDLAANLNIPVADTYYHLARNSFMAPAPQLTQSFYIRPEITLLIDPDGHLYEMKRPAEVHQLPKDKVQILSHPLLNTWFQTFLPEGVTGGLVSGFLSMCLSRSELGWHSMSEDEMAAVEAAAKRDGLVMFFSEYPEAVRRSLYATVVGYLRPRMMGSSFNTDMFAPFDGVEDTWNRPVAPWIMAQPRPGQAFAFNGGPYSVPAGEPNLSRPLNGGFVDSRGNYHPEGGPNPYHYPPQFHEDGSVVLGAPHVAQGNLAEVANRVATKSAIDAIETGVRDALQYPGGLPGDFGTGRLG